MWLVESGGRKHLLLKKRKMTLWGIKTILALIKKLKNNKMGVRERKLSEYDEQSARVFPPLKLLVLLIIKVQNLLKKRESNSLKFLSIVTPPSVIIGHTIGNIWR